MRVQWRGVAKTVAAIAVGLIALQLLPELLRPPQAPPLAADVGLPRPGAAEPDLAISEAEPEPGPAPGRRAKPKPRVSHGLSAATAAIGSTPRRRQPERRRARGEFFSDDERTSPGPHSGPTPAPEPPAYVPPPEPPAEPEFMPAPAPEPPPPPGDGSVEFAPH